MEPAAGMEIWPWLREMPLVHAGQPGPHEVAGFRLLGLGFGV